MRRLHILATFWLAPICHCLDGHHLAAAWLAASWPPPGCLLATTWLPLGCLLAGRLLAATWLPIGWPPLGRQLVASWLPLGWLPLGWLLPGRLFGAYHLASSWLLSGHLLADSSLLLGWLPPGPILAAVWPVFGCPLMTTVWPHGHILAGCNLASSLPPVATWLPCGWPPSGLFAAAWLAAT